MPPTYGGGPARCGRARVRAACARQSGLRAVWAAPGASWRRKPGRRAGFLGPPSDCWGPGRRPRWATGGCPPPGADRRPGCARSGGENRKFPPRRWLRSVPRGQPMATWPHGNVATWQRGNVATWQRGLMATWQHGIVASVSLRRRCPSWNGGFRLLLVFDTPGPRCAGHYNQTEPNYSHFGRM